MIVARIIRVPFIILWVLIYILYSTLLRISIRSKNRRIRTQINTTSFFCRILLLFLGIKIKKEGIDNLNGFKNGLMVANHLSYIDILVLISIIPAIFISSVEVEKTFLLGYIVKLGGTLFIERRSKAGLPTEIEKITQKLREGFSVTFFPEGTTTDGGKMKKFKSSFFESVVNSNKEVLPVCIFYESIGKKHITKDNRDKIFYYGDMSFFPHFFKLLFVKNIKVKVVFLERIKGINERKDVSEIAYQRINYEYERLKSKYGYFIEERKDEKEIESIVCMHS